MVFFSRALNENILDAERYAIFFLSSGRKRVCVYIYGVFVAFARTLIS